MKRHLKIFTGLAVVICLAIGFPAVAATLYWTGGAGTSDWHTAGNWTPAQLPVNGDDVVINAGTTPVTYSTGSTTLASLSIGGGFQLQVVGGTLAVGGNGTVADSGELRVGGGSAEFAIGGTLTVDGSLLLDVGRLSGPGTVHLRSGSSMDLAGMGGATLDQVAVDAEGGSALVWFPNPLSLDGGTSITIQEGGSFQLQGGELQAGSGGGSITNDGTIQVVENSQSWLYDVYFDVPVTNDGTLVSLNDYSTMIFRTGGLTNQAGGVLTGNGTIAVFAGTPFQNAGVIAPGNSPGSLEFSVGDTLPHESSSAWEIELGGTQPGQYDEVVVTGALELDGSLNPRLWDGFTPQLGDTFRIATFTSISGDFATTGGDPPGNCMGWVHWASSGALSLRVSSLGPLLAVETAHDAEPVTVGETATVLAQVSNRSPYDATGTTLTITLPPELTFGSATPSQGSCSESGGTVTCDLGTVGIWRDAAVTVTATANAAATVSVPASVTANECDPVTDDDSASVALRLVTAAACDADGNGTVEADDLPETVGEIFGNPAGGNPDCTRSGGTTAADLAAIIDDIFST